jgi:hypothetical protein
MGGCLCHPIVPGNELKFAASFLGMALFGRVREKILERSEQERAESTPARVSQFQKITFEDHDEEILREILCVADRIASPTNKGEDGPPVGAAKLGEGTIAVLVRARWIGTKNHAPMRRGELIGVARCQGRIVRFHEFPS